MNTCLRLLSLAVAIALTSPVVAAETVEPAAAFQVCETPVTSNASRVTVEIHNSVDLEEGDIVIFSDKTMVLSDAGGFADSSASDGTYSTAAATGSVFGDDADAAEETCGTWTASKWKIDWDIDCDIDIIGAGESCPESGEVCGPVEDGSILGGPVWFCVCLSNCGGTIGTSGTIGD